MMLWVAITLIGLGLIGWMVLWSTRRKPADGSRDAFDLTVYRDQIREIETDLERGVLDDAAAASARLEVERRILKLADIDREEEGGGPAQPRAAASVLISGIMVAAAAGLYLIVGRPDLPAQPFAERPPPTETEPAADPAMAAAVQQLAARLQENPEDFRGWMLLGRSYAAIQQFDDAAAAFAKAIALPEGQENAAAHANLGEAMIFAADGTVGPPAKASLGRALAIDPAAPRPRYYLALAEAQAGNLQAAYDGWLALARTTPADAPWRELLMGNLRGAAAQLNINLPTDLAAAAPPGPSSDDVAAAAEMSADERAEMIAAMVDRLAKRLQQQPDDLEGWLRLGRAYTVLGNGGEAAAAYGEAAALKPEDTELQLQYVRAAIAATESNNTVPPPARRVLEAVLARAPDNREALWYLGLADLQAGDNAAAAARWEKLLALLPADAPERQTVARGLEALQKATGAGQ